MASNGKSVGNRISGGSFLSDDEFVVIRLGQQQNQESNDEREEEEEEEALQLQKTPQLKDSPFRATNSLDQGNSAGESHTQIRRITMKKEPPSRSHFRKKDSVTSIVVDRKESLKTPLIVQTQSIDSATSHGTAADEDDIDDDTDRSSISRRIRRKSSFLEPLNKTDLPRSLRSTRRLSACNEQVLMEAQLNLFMANASSSSRRSSRRSSSIIENVKCGGGSCDGIVVAKTINDSGKNQVGPASNNTTTSRSRVLVASQNPPTTKALSSQQQPPIWGQFHFLTNNGSISVAEMNSRLQQVSNASNLILQNSTVSRPDDTGGGGLMNPKHAIILLPSSYDLEAKTAPDDDGCFNIILLGGFVILFGMISAGIGLLFGFI